ncbi:MAG TPA: DUF485 domain-containing protein [Vicinamibacteria bacterium]|jgi:uncharacterized membrane protein (DUF485 family)
MTEATDVTRLAARRWRLALALTAAMLFVYLGFILLIAFAKPVLAAHLTGGLTVGILLGVLVIVSAWVLTWVYVRWANQVYDPALRDLHSRGERAH